MAGRARRDHASGLRVITGTPPDPLGLGHRVHVATTDAGYEARCVCGWHTSQPTRDQRQADIDNHHAVPRTRGNHGDVSEGD